MCLLFDSGKKLHFTTLFAAKVIYVHKCKHCCTLATQWVGTFFQGVFFLKISIFLTLNK